eukprot:4942335-Alexandrium_andersonii.AAC.1
MLCTRPWSAQEGHPTPKSIQRVPKPARYGKRAWESGGALVEAWPPVLMQCIGHVAVASGREGEKHAHRPSCICHRTTTVPWRELSRARLLVSELLCLHREE